ncbi:MAG: GTP-binding protein [Thaumarchaeota archaeon]|nr:GTP-binding protein [Nitrososphaerota archaeon]
MGIPEKIKRVEDDLHRTQVNKKTEHHVGLLKAKLAKLRREQEEARTRGGASSIGYDIKKSGDATVVLIGLPNVGKSTLMNRITNSKSKVGGYQFTTLTVVPGVMTHKGARIQILDLPGIIEGASAGKGLGRRVLSVARSADLILFVLDVFQPEALSLLIKELRGIGIRPDEQPPNLVIEKTNSGGVSVTGQVKMTKISSQLIKDILAVYDLHNARVMIREDITDEQLIDAILGNRTYVPALAVMNKIDLVNAGFMNELKSRLTHDFIPISADGNINVEALKEEIYRKLDFIRVYMRPRGGETDYVEPMIVRRGAQVLDVCNRVHRSMKDELRYAQIWGKSTKFAGQKVGLTHHLMDEDVLTLVTK